MDNIDKIRETVYKFGARAVEEWTNENVVTLTAQKVDNYLSLLSGYSGMIEEELGEIEVRKAQEWPNFRDYHKSNVDAKNAWESTPDGLRLIKLKRLMNGVDKIRSACKSRLERLKEEGRNRY